MTEHHEGCRWFIEQCALRTLQTYYRQVTPPYQWLHVHHVLLSISFLMKYKAYIMHSEGPYRLRSTCVISVSNVLLFFYCPLVTSNRKVVLLWLTTNNLLVDLSYSSTRGLFSPSLEDNSCLWRCPLGEITTTLFES